MFTKSAAATAVALATLASAQTFTACNPLEKKCPANPAFGNEKVNCDFTQGPCSAFYELEGTNLEYNENGAVFEITTEGTAPTIATSKYIFFGRVDVELQAAAGAGIVTSAVLQSADLDEIDWEWVGNDDVQVQSNYFGKGDTSTYDRGAYHPADTPTTAIHTYSIEWTSEKIDWIVNGNVVRTLLYSEAQGGSRFPQTPMEVKLGTWVAGKKDNPEGTVEWAGGYTDFSEAPFIGYYKSVKIVDYAGGNAPATDDIKEYVWTDRTGSFESISAVKGDGSSDTPEPETTTTKAPKPTTSTTTKAPKPTTTEETTTEETTTTEEATTTSEEETTTTEASSTTETTLTTATSETTTTTSSAPETTPTGDSTSSEAEGDAPRFAVFGSAIVATAGLMLAQLLL